MSDATEPYELVLKVTPDDIDYRKPARPGDDIIARTWVGPAAKLSYERHTQILWAGTRELLAQARTLWCPVDRQSGRPSQISAGVQAIFSTGTTPARRIPEN